MGVKRPFDGKDLTELSLKQSKQLDRGNYKEDFPCAITSPKADFPGEAKSDVYKLQSSMRLENGHTNGPSMADKELETSAPLSWVTSSSGEEDTGMEDATFGSYFPRYFDFSIPQQLPEQFEDPYSLMLNCSPRKEVPVGPDHQAELLPWGVNANENDCLGYNFIVDNYREQKPIGTCIVPMPDNSIIESSLLSCSSRKEVPVGPDHQAEVLPWGVNVTGKDCIDSNFTDDHCREQRLMGTCIIPMPDYSTIDGVRVGHGRIDCCCLDVGSMKCVHQHVKEAREKLQETIGDEKFTELGFYDMGEEVACKWTADDERLFHDIILSNSTSLGRNFWKHLSAAFPIRTKKEIVSYYFNVFMLQRRAIQNRSYLLEIDSDDDEWKGARGDFYQNRSNFSDSDIDDEDDGDNDDDNDNDEQQGACENFYQDRSHVLYLDVDGDDDYERLGAHGDLYQVAEEDKYSTVYSFGNQDLPVGRGDNSSPESENVCGDEGRNHSDGTFHGNCNCNGNDNVNK